MNSKFYVSLEAARLLKEKGYDMKRDFLTPVYIENGYHIENGSLFWSNHEDLSDKIPAITKAEAIDWLESKGMRINIIYDWLECRWYFTIINGSPTVKNITELEVSDFGFYKTRLEAEEAAIINACELLKGKEE